MQNRIADGFSLARNPGPIRRYPKESTGCARSSSLERHSKAWWTLKLCAAPSDDRALSHAMGYRGSLPRGWGIAGCHEAPLDERI